MNGQNVLKEINLSDLESWVKRRLASPVTPLFFKLVGEELLERVVLQLEKTTRRVGVVSFGGDLSQDFLVRLSSQQKQHLSYMALDSKVISIEKSWWSYFKNKMLSPASSPSSPSSTTSFLARDWLNNQEKVPKNLDLVVPLLLPFSEPLWNSLFQLLQPNQVWCGVFLGALSGYQQQERLVFLDAQTLASKLTQQGFDSLMVDTWDFCFGYRQLDDLVREWSPWVRQANLFDGNAKNKNDKNDKNEVKGLVGKQQWQRFLAEIKQACFNPEQNCFDLRVELVFFRGRFNPLSRINQRQEILISPHQIRRSSRH